MATQTEDKKQQAKEAIDNTAENVKNKTDDAKQSAKSMVDKAGETAQNVADKAKSAGKYAKDKADDGVGYAGQGVESSGEYVREHGPKNGILGKANTAVADGLEQTGEYLQEKGLSGMAGDMTELIKKHPVPAVLIGVGLGFALARMTSRS